MSDIETQMIFTGADIDTLARTVYGEARGESEEGRFAVAWVVCNRTANPGWWGTSIESVCRKEWQFSCWNKNDPNRVRIQAANLDMETFRQCLLAAAAVLGGFVKDPTGGATHYHAEGSNPAWKDGREPCATIGKHIFYKGIK